MQTRFRVVGWRRFGAGPFTGRYQELRKEWLLFGIVIWSVVLDSEDVPSYVEISNACFGDTSGWASKFASKYGPFGRDGIKIDE